MADLAREAALTHLIAPVRPEHQGPPTRWPRSSGTSAWNREDGEPFDPWIRIHTRRGGTIAKPVPHSMQIAGTVADWEKWTKLRFPDVGPYVFPAGLAPVEIDPRTRSRHLLGTERLDHPCDRDQVRRPGEPDHLTQKPFSSSMMMWSLHSPWLPD